MKILKRVKEKGKQLLSITALLLVLSNLATAGTFDNVTDLLNDVVDIFPPILLIVLAVLPILIAMAIVNFVVGLFAGLLISITGRMKGF